MFSRNHLIWLGISLPVIALALYSLVRNKLPLKKVLRVCCILAVLSEYIKVFSSVEMLPMSAAEGLFPYLNPGHFPFHLCSIQIPLIFYVSFARPSETRDTVLAFMYPTCVAGAFLALLLPSIFTNSIDVSQAFTHPLAYQYFLWHCALIILGFYIPVSGEVKLTKKRWAVTCAGMIGLAFLSIYINSACSSPVYADGKAVGLDYVTNFFFTMRTPIGLSLNTKGQWILYYLIIHLLSAAVISLLYLPFMCRDGCFHKNTQKRKDAQ